MSIKGNPVGTTTPRPDWNQNNPKKADFIKNKPDIPVIDITLKQAGKAADAKAVGDALANLPSGNGGIYVGSGDMPDGYNVQIDPNGEAVDISEKWELIRDDTLTEEALVYRAATDNNGNAFALKKLKIIVTLDTTQGVYKDGTITFNFSYDGTHYGRSIYANKPLPTTDGKFGMAVFDGEVLDSKLYSQVVFANNLDSLTWADLNNPLSTYRNVGYPLHPELVESFEIRIGNGQAFKVGTRIVVWGVRA